MADEKKPQGVQFNHPAAAHVIVKDGERGIVFCHPKREKVAIVGYAETSREETPWNDPSFEIWGMNQLYRLVPRMDRLFEIHTNWEEHNVEGTDHRGYIQASPIPVYMAEYLPQFPNCVKYPLAAVSKHIFGNEDTRYFTSSVAFMLGLAIMEGFKEIHLFGIDLVVGDEYVAQKPNTEFFIGFACARGINVVIPTTSALCKQTHTYGYELEPNKPLIQYSEVIAKYKNLQDQREEMFAQVKMLDGAIELCRFMLHTMDIRKKGAVFNLPKA